MLQGAVMATANKTELKYYGVNAVLAVFAVRPQDIVKVLLLESRKREMSELLKWCAKEKKAYRFVGRDDLDKLTESTHHEGGVFGGETPGCAGARRRGEGSPPGTDTVSRWHRKSAQLRFDSPRCGAL
jgi:tRNA G18 (ribose-2'-O)-methylase SpoU